MKKNIVVCVTGGIAAYKAADLVSKLSKVHNVRVLMTRDAVKFVGSETFKILSKNNVYTDVFNDEAKPMHIEIAKWADIFVVVPASANTIAKLASGICDDMVTLAFLASKAKKLVVPAMNTAMLENLATQDNIQTLKDRGIDILDSDSGLLACGDIGKGKMPDPDRIIDRIDYLLSEKDLKKYKILVTAGHTVEAIDPVRYISNRSTGKMGYQIALKAYNRGANVTLIIGPNDLDIKDPFNIINVVSSKDMYEAVNKEFEGADALIMAAAPADFTPAEYSEEKIKKEDSDNHDIKIKKTDDIIKSLKDKKDDKVVIGFAAESENVIANAKKKLLSKGADMIVANDITLKGSGFKSDENKVSFVYKNKNATSFDLMKKSELADIILDNLAVLLKDRKKN